MSEIKTCCEDFKWEELDTTMKDMKSYPALKEAAQNAATAAAEFSAKQIEKALQTMTRTDCFTVGLAGDYSEVCLECLRVFDVADADPARLLPEMQDFMQALQSYSTVAVVLSLCLELGSCAGPSPRCESLHQVLSLLPKHLRLALLA